VSIGDLQQWRSAVVSGRGGSARGPGPRSVEALRWLARLEVAGVEPLGLALGFGRSATYSHLARLVDAGLIARGYDRDGSVVAITAAGRRAIGADRGDVRAGATHGSGLRHARAVSWVAALLTLRRRVWVSEHEFRHDEAWQIPVVWASSRGRHRPDLGVVMGEARVAVEVELSHKSPRRLRAILAGHEEAIASGRIAGGLIYVSDRADVLDAVARAAARAGVSERRFRTRSLADVEAEVRRLAHARRASANSDGPLRANRVARSAGSPGVGSMGSLSAADAGRAER
jgi:DNA-binding transcriptional ArsR family regulator